MTCTKTTTPINPTRLNKGKRARTDFSPPEEHFDKTRFRDAKIQECFEIIKNWSFIEERRVELNEGECEEFNDEITRRHWRALAKPLEKYDPDIGKREQGYQEPAKPEDQPEPAAAPPPHLTTNDQVIKQIKPMRLELQHVGQQNTGPLRYLWRFNNT
ncbi:hypothetical protein SESBI_14463 [Sesbania bispinosa]|nr:hypothetical protein SESBI_14463 [Sesbania bispinosa]